MTLRFENYYYRYEAASFAASSENFAREGDDLVISIDSSYGDNEITILDAYDSDPDTGTGNAAFTINIEFGYGDTFTAVTDAFLAYPNLRLNLA